MRDVALRVLVVDDDYDSAEVLSYVLRSAGCEVRVALDGSAALAVVAEFEPDAAIVDLGLPTMTGYDLVGLLRSMPALQACRFLAITGYIANGLAERSAAAGFVAHFTKPVRSVELLAALGIERIEERKANL
jgi:CheY-like chemotaxis protein